VETLKLLKSFCERRLDHPVIQHTSLYRRIAENFHYEFQFKGENYLLSPLYTLLRGESFRELDAFIRDGEAFLDSLREFILNTIFVYSAVVEENAYFLSGEQDILIARMIHRTGVGDGDSSRFEVKLYSHYQDELQNAYNDKIYIGRVFIDVGKFTKEYLGLNEYFHSILEQNTKIQERAKHKLRYYEDYKKSDLDEIDYLAKDVSGEALERIKLLPRTDLKSAPTVTLLETADNLLHIQNLMIELRDFTQDFENRLRLREENNYVRYVTKFSKDLVNDLKYLTKLNLQISLKIARHSII
jgi:hypothetical protein